MSQPLIMIVPGGFIKPAAYDDVSKELSHLGYTVIVPSLTVYGDLSKETPESQAWKELAQKGCPDDVKMLHSYMLPAFQEGKEVVLVGHSYGTVPGYLSLEGQSVAERHARGEKGGVKAFVNLAGFAYPARGKTILGGDEDLPPLPYQHLEAGILQLQDDAKQLLFSDISPEEQDKAWSSNVHKTMSHLSLLHRPQFLALDLRLPKYYIRTLKDETVNADFQAMFIQYGQFNDEFELPSGHCPMTSMPDKLAAVLDEIAKR